MGLYRKAGRGLSPSKFVAQARSDSRDMFPGWFPAASAVALVLILGWTAFSMSRDTSVPVAYLPAPTAVGAIAGATSTVPETTLPAAEPTTTTSNPDSPAETISVPRAAGGSVDVPLAAFDAIMAAAGPERQPSSPKVILSGQSSVLMTVIVQTDDGEETLTLSAIRTADGWVTG